MSRAATSGDAVTISRRLSASDRHLFRLTPLRFIVEAVVDGATWAAALLLATAVRYDLEVTRIDGVALAAFASVAAMAQIVVGLGSGLYTGRWRFGSFDEVAGLVRVVAIVSGVLFVLDRWATGPRLVPLSAPLAGAFVALVLMAGVRFGWRLARERSRRPGGEDLQRVLVFGAGEGGVQVVTAMLRDAASPYLPVGLLDDDPSKRNLQILGVPVIGGRRRLGEAASTLRADLLLIAIPSAEPALVTEVTALAGEAGLRVKILPRLRELFGTVGLQHIRDIAPVDLLGRHEVEVDLTVIAEYLAGRRVLVTGAGGSIGSELCRQIHAFGPSELIMLDRDESALHAVQLSLEGRALLDSSDLVLMNINDEMAVQRLFATRRPEVVFHAAALKHLTLLERHPGEAVQTNVWGTLRLLRIAAAAGVRGFVNISTDKAADPCCVLGYSKRIAERLTAYYGDSSEGTYLSVRFGNVLGSRGSVLTSFRAQVAAGGPVTVTDPEVTRYFMTVEEAVHLVIQAGAIGRSGEALVLDMGKPVRIADVARIIAARSERPVEVVFTGLRPGEKCHEVLFGQGEIDLRPIHPMISHVVVPPLEPIATEDLDPYDEPTRLVRELRNLTLVGQTIR